MENPNRRLTDAERAELMEKMDDDLDKFMEDLASKQNKERKEFNFDEWCKDIDQHPAFMKDLENKDGEYSEAIQALQALKYEEAETEEDKQLSAERNKNEGNKHLKFKKYRWAVDCYTQGIKVMCLDRRLNSVLYANRAASQKYLGNLRSAFGDCVFARRFDPLNLKAIIRGAECLLELGYGRQCLSWIESSRKSLTSTGPEAEKQLETLTDLQKKASERVIVEERNSRRERAQNSKEISEKKKLLTALKDRKLSFRPKINFGNVEAFEWSSLETQLPQLHQHQRVDFDGEGNLCWPLLVQYPEVGQTDILTECGENVIIGELMSKVLENPAEWDDEHKYNLQNVSFFVADEYDEYLIEVLPWYEFGKMISLPGYTIRKGLPVLIVYTNEKVEKSLKRVNDENKFIVI